MRIAKWLLVLLVLAFLFYAGSVAWFEIRLGVTQGMRSTSLVLATFDDDGGRRFERVLRLARIDGNDYIAVNHWPRMWYNRALANPEVEVRMPGSETFAPYTAVPLSGAELARVEGEYAVPPYFRFRTGYPPRRFMRLDPHPPPPPSP